MTKKFEQSLKIYNWFFYKDKKPNDIFKAIKPNGFTVYCFILAQQQNGKTITTINELSNRIKCLKTRSIKNNILDLVEHKIIKVNNIADIKNIRSGTILEIEIIPKDNKYILISKDLFFDSIEKIDSTGWSILVLLSMLHNYEFGSKLTNYPYGYACPSINEIGKVLDISKNTIIKYLQILNSAKLIKIIHNNNYQDDDSGKFINFGNYYVVQNRIPNSKYYLRIFDKLIS